MRLSAPLLLLVVVVVVFALCWIVGLACGIAFGAMGLVFAVPICFCVGYGAYSFAIDHWGRR